jgi:phosphoribosylformylglycinamidine (FGAM) synthase-like amidotransferase family enzyme
MPEPHADSASATRAALSRPSDLEHLLHSIPGGVFIYEESPAGEGRLVFPDSKILDEVRAKNLAPLVYVDSDNEPTEKYPMNPNGSGLGLTALCSPDGRHLAMMPHPERAIDLSTGSQDGLKMFEGLLS